MNGLVNIAVIEETQVDAQRLAAQQITTMPVVVISLHEGCDCRCVMCDIWKIREPQAFPIAKLRWQLQSFDSLGVRWVVFTGGEPQRHPHFADFASALKSRGIRVTLLTAGLELEGHADEVASSVDDLIVSLDGPPEVHNRIRRVPLAFERMARGFNAVRESRPEIPIRARSTVQAANHGSLCATVECAAQNGLASISFLAADLTSDAFNRPSGWTASRQSSVALTSTQVCALEDEIESLIAAYECGGFVAETPEKLRRIVTHFRAHLGQVPAVAPRCNAPWVSAVIEAGGQVRPCFFHAPIGNIDQQTVAEAVNSNEALQFRANLDIATNPTCRRCVCSLYLPGT
jgi:MoaA/NifB/PqqE/SkfB family radical SAM enzyme